MPHITTVRNLRDTKEGVYIGRGSYYGNPFSHLENTKFLTVKVGSREEAVQAYEDWLNGVAYSEVEPERQKIILSRIEELKNQTLLCFCYPKSCHGDVLIRFLDKLFP